MKFKENDVVKTINKEGGSTFIITDKTKVLKNGIISYYARGYYSHYWLHENKIELANKEEKENISKFIKDEEEWLCS